MRSDSVYMTILEMYLTLFLPSESLVTLHHSRIFFSFGSVDAEEFRLLLMPTSNTSISTVLSSTAHHHDPRLQLTNPMESTPK